MYNLTAVLRELEKDIDDAVQRLKESEKLPIEELLEKYQIMKERYDELDSARKLLFRQLDRLNKQVLPAKFEDRGVDKIQLRNLARSFYRLTKHSASMPDKEKGYEWLRDNNAEHLITETVNSGTLASFLKEHLEGGGEDPPEEAIRMNTYQIIGSSKYTPR